MNYKSIIQVEITTSCQASCTFCPRSVLEETWLSKNIVWEHFTPVLSKLNGGTLVHLQGWGEPLLHPRLWDMAAAVRQRKGMVSLTTNAMLMDESAAREITRIGLEFVAISLAHTDCTGHAELRTGTDLNRISANIAHVCSLKNRPRVHIAVQMMKSNMEQLPKLVELAARLGADRVIASNLDCVVGADVDNLKAFGHSPDPFCDEIIEAVKRRGRELNIEVEIYPLQVKSELPVCAAGPLRTTVITVSGEIAPCTYLSLPLAGDIPRIFLGQMHSVPRFVFGNATDGIERTLHHEPAHSFFTMYKRRLRAATMRTAGNFASFTIPSLRSAQKKSMEQGLRSVSPLTIPDLPPEPPHCRFCYKLYGV